MSYRRCRHATVLAALVLSLASCGRIDPNAELAAASENLAAHQYEEAAIRLNNVLQVQPDNAEARRQRGELALLLGDYPGAVEDLDRARSLGVPEASIVLSLAEALTLTRQEDRALTLLESAEEAFTGDALYWTVRAEALLGAGRLADAERALDRVDAVRGGVRAAVAHARIEFGRANTAEAERLLTEALAAAPDDARILTTRAELFARIERFPEAAADLQRAADIHRAASLRTREAETLLALAQVQLAGNQLDAAETTAARLAELAPQAAGTAYMRGLVEYRNARFDEAADLIQPLVNASPDVIQFRSLLAAIHLARGNFGQAEQQLQAVLASAPRDPAAIKLLAETHLRQQRPEAALATLRALADTAAEDPQVGLLSGLANLLTGNAEQGLLYLEQAAALDPTNELLKLQLARAYLAVGRDADASTLLKSTFGGEPAALEAGLMRLFADIRIGAANVESDAASELLEQFPRDPRALTAVAIYHQIRGENERARQLFEQAAAQETTGATARLIVAAALVQEGRSQEAERLLVSVVDQLPDNTQALMALAELLTARGAYDEAAKYLNRAAEQSTSVSPRLALAQLQIRKGDLDAAARELDAAAVAAPTNAEVVATRGLLALAAGRADEAATLLRQAEGDLPNRLGIVLALARAEIARGRPGDARTELRRVLSAAPRSLPLRFVLAEAELALGNAAETLSIASELKAEYPAQSAGYILEAEASLAARRYGAAANSYGAAFERDARWSVMARWLGALELAGQRDEMLRIAERWVAANPQDVTGTLTLAGLLQTADRGQEALAVYEKVLGLDGNNIIGLNNAAWLRHELSQPGALAYAERSYALAPDNAAVLDTLGWILLSENREAEAVEYLSRAQQLAPSAPEIRYHLGTALAANDRPAEARAMLTPLLEPTIDFEDKAEAARLLESL